MNDVVIREIEEAHFTEGLALAWRVFQEYEAPDYSEEGIDEFYRSIHDEKYLSKLSMFGAYVNGHLVGLIATRSHGTHIVLFFVDGDYHRQGIGKRLFQKILECGTASKLTVNSSPYAVPTYHKLGFCETDQEQTVNGLRFIPMAYEDKE